MEAFWLQDFACMRTCATHLTAGAPELGRAAAEVVRAGGGSGGRLVLEPKQRQLALGWGRRSRS